MDRDQEITDLLIAMRGGDSEAAHRLLPLVYEELRRMAHRHLRGEREGHTLSTTALVHEAYLKLADQTRIVWNDRTHFLAVAAGAMRRILIDYARQYQATKRGGGQQRLTLEEETIPVEQRADELLALDDALTRLSALDPRLGQVVELRFFGGLSEEEAAQSLGVTARTVRRDWVKARGWLYQQLYT